MNKREKVGLTLLTAAAIVGGKAFLSYLRRGVWRRFW